MSTSSDAASALASAQSAAASAAAASTALGEAVDLVVTPNDSTVATLVNTPSSSTALALSATIDAAVAAVGVRAHRTTNLSIPNNADTAVAWDAEDYDTHGFHDPATNPSRVTIPTGRGGLYAITGSAEWADGGTAAGLRGIALRKNGSVYIGQGPTITAAITTEMRQQVHATVSLVAGDYVEMTLFQNCGAPQTVNAYVVGNSSLGSYGLEVVQVGKS